MVPASLPPHLAAPVLPGEVCVVLGKLILSWLLGVEQVTQAEGWSDQRDSRDFSWDEESFCRNQ